MTTRPRPVLYVVIVRNGKPTDEWAKAIAKRREAGK